MTRTQSVPSPLQSPSLALLAAEPFRALFDFCAGKVAVRPPAQGDGHPVIVYPGLGAGALGTAALRSFLVDCGFAATDWGGGVNTGPDGDFDAWLAGWVDRVRELQRQHDRKVSLIGWSLGGVYAREIAKCCPESVRQVITLATPFAALRNANHAGAIYRLLGGDTSQLTPEMQARLRECPPVPTTSIYSRTDGVVSWQGCLAGNGARTQNVEVNASHLGIVSHPDTMRVVLDRLLQQEDAFEPYRPARIPGAARVRASTSPGRCTK